LHGQLTQDVALLGLTEARLAAFCSAKGRMQASFAAQTQPDRGAGRPQDILAPTLKRLSMLRAKAEDGWVPVLIIRCGDWLARRWMPWWPLTARPGDPELDLDTGGIGGGAVPGRRGATRPVGGPMGTPVPEGPAFDAATWAWGEVAAGIAMVSAPVVDAFVPQMLNYESVGGVELRRVLPAGDSSTQPGYRGTLKRRAYLAHAGVAMAAGTEIFQAGEPDQPCGVVAQAAAVPAGAPAAGGPWLGRHRGRELSAVEAGDLHLGSATAPPWR
jgi:hypothetical protein